MSEGDVDRSDMLPLTEAQVSLREQARRLAQDEIAERAATVDAREEYPWENVRALVREGYMGMTIPRAYGGQGRTCWDAVLVIEQLAQVCSTTARIAVEANMGAIGAIMAYGTDEQKRLAATCVLEGDKPAICITEPEAGSAAAEMTTRADSLGEQYIINGKKHWITGGGVSRLHLIFARVYENGRPQGIGGFLALSGQEGLRVGYREPTMGIRGCPETEIFFEDLMVPANMALPLPGGYANGFRSLMNAYNGQRVGAATVALGIAQGAFELACDRTKRRRQFGRPICEFQGVQWMLADMSTQLSASRCLIQGAAAAAGTGFPEAADSARAKIFTAESASNIVSDCLQLFGAEGYSRRLPLERMYRDVRMFTIGGGTTQILRTAVASSVLGQKLPQRLDGYAPSDQSSARDRAGDAVRETQE